MSFDKSQIIKEKQKIIDKLNKSNLLKEYSVPSQINNVSKFNVLTNEAINDEQNLTNFLQNIIKYSSSTETINSGKIYYIPENIYNQIINTSGSINNYLKEIKPPTNQQLIKINNDYIKKAYEGNTQQITNPDFLLKTPSAGTPPGLPTGTPLTPGLPTGTPLTPGLPPLKVKAIAKPITDNIHMLKLAVDIFNLIKGKTKVSSPLVSPIILPFILNKNYPAHKETDIDDTQALINGNIIYNDLLKFLNSIGDFSVNKGNLILSENEKNEYSSFYNIDQHKMWLGREIYFMLAQQDISTGYSRFDDGLSFFNWLTHQKKSDIFNSDAPIIPSLKPSPPKATKKQKDIIQKINDSMVTGGAGDDLYYSSSKIIIPTSGLGLFSQSCFMNATIQMLYSIPELKLLFDENIDTEIDSLFKITPYTDNTLNKDALKKLQELFIMMKTNPSIDNNKEIYDALGEKPNLNNSLQEDAQEFLSYILDCFNYPENALFMYITNLFKFTITDSFKCNDGSENEKINADPYDTIIKLTLDEASDTSIQSTLNSYQKFEKYTFEELPKIEGCKPDITKTDKYIRSFDKVEIIKTLTYNATEKKLNIKIDDNLNYIIIHLKRFRDLHTKNFKEIDYDKEITINGIKFKLYGIVIHHGDTLNGGHYSYQIFDENSNAFYNISDTTINTGHDDDIIKKNGYLYLYRRINKPLILKYPEDGKEKQIKLPDYYPEVIGVKFMGLHTKTDFINYKYYLENEDNLIIYNENFNQFDNLEDISEGGGNGVLRKYRSDYKFFTEDNPNRIKDNIKASVLGIPSGTGDEFDFAGYIKYKMSINMAFLKIEKVIMEKKIKRVFFSCDNYAGFDNPLIGLSIYAAYTGSQNASIYITTKFKKFFGQKIKYYPYGTDLENSTDLFAFDEAEKIKISEELKKLGEPTITNATDITFINNIKKQLLSIITY